MLIVVIKPVRNARVVGKAEKHPKHYFKMFFSSVVEIYNSVFPVVDLLDFFDDSLPLVFSYPAVELEIKSVFVASTLYVTHDVSLTYEKDVLPMTEATLIASGQVKG